MQSLLVELAAEVSAGRQRRVDVWPWLRMAGVALVLSVLAFEVGQRTAMTPDTFGARADLKDRALAMNATIEAQKGEIELQRAYIERLERIHQLSARYGIGADMAARIEDIALSENVDPKIAFELVRVESRFNPRAVSPVGAIGLTQVMPATARWMEPNITRQQLFEPETNLRLGFRFLNALLKTYDGDLRLALLAYNRGPATVDRLLAQGINPDNGYARMVLGKKK